MENGTITRRIGNYYRSYYYKPYTSYNSYKYHYVVYYPSCPRYYYYYNPYRRVYWGHYDLEKKGYSLLPEAKRKGKLDEIAESDFPEPGKMPAVPEVTEGDDRTIEVPPTGDKPSLPEED